jgi:hypothetical protein
MKLGAMNQQRREADYSQQRTLPSTFIVTDLALCINRYRLFSPGWSVCVMAKVQLSAESLRFRLRSCF